MHAGVNTSARVCARPSHMPPYDPFELLYVFAVLGEPSPASTAFMLLMSSGLLRTRVFVGPRQQGGVLTDSRGLGGKRRSSLESAANRRSGASDHIGNIRGGGLTPGGRAPPQVCQSTSPPPTAGF